MELTFKKNPPKGLQQNFRNPPEILLDLGVADTDLEVCNGISKTVESDIAWGSVDEAADAVHSFLHLFHQEVRLRPLRGKSTEKGNIGFVLS